MNLLSAQAKKQLNEVLQEIFLDRIVILDVSGWAEDA